MFFVPLRFRLTHLYPNSLDERVKLAMFFYLEIAKKCACDRNGDQSSGSVLTKFSNKLLGTSLGRVCYWPKSIQPLRIGGYFKYFENDILLIANYLTPITQIQIWQKNKTVK